MQGIINDFTNMQKLKRSINVALPDGTTATAEITPTSATERNVAINMGGENFNANVSAPPQDAQQTGPVPPLRPKPQPMGPA